MIRVSGGTVQSLSRSGNAAPKSASSNVDPDKAFAALDKVADTPANSPEVVAQDEALDLFSAEEPSLERERVPVVQHRVSEARVVSIPIPVSTRLEVERPPVPVEVAQAFTEVERPAPDVERPSLEAQRSSYKASAVELPTESTAHTGGKRNTRQVLIVAAIVVLSVIAAVQAIFLIRGMRVESAAAAVPPTGTVSVQSTPAGRRGRRQRPGAGRHAAHAYAQPWRLQRRSGQRRCVSRGPCHRCSRNAQ